MPKHRVSVQREGDETSPFVCIDQRTGNCLAAWTSDVSPGPKALIAGAADADGDAIADRSGTVSDTIVFTLASTAGTNTVKFLGRLDEGTTREVPGTNRFSGLGPGMHTFRVSAVDRHGATNPTPALFTWEVLTPQGGVNALANRVQELVGDGVLSVEQAGSLNEKLRAAVLHFEGQRMDSGARELSAFFNQVRVYARAGILMASEEANLLREGRKIEKALGQKQTAKWE